MKHKINEFFVATCDGNETKKKNKKQFQNPVGK
jgi:hypothetical protein